MAWWRYFPKAKTNRACPSRSPFYSLFHTHSLSLPLMLSDLSYSALSRSQVTSLSHALGSLVLASHTFTGHILYTQGYTHWQPCLGVISEAENPAICHLFVHSFSFKTDDHRNFVSTMLKLAAWIMFNLCSKLWLRFLSHDSWTRIGYFIIGFQPKSNAMFFSSSCAAAEKFKKSLR